MSNGAQIGGVIGAAVGLYVSGGNLQAAQLGYAIGPATGGFIDPEVFFGPRLAAESEIIEKGNSR